MRLEYFVVGPTKNTGRYYAGYRKPSDFSVFIPMASCTTENQAKQACIEFEREANIRDKKASAAPWNAGMWIPVRGFYEDNE